MNFTIPRNNDSEMLLYIWKIIDLPTISQKALIYKISFELFLYSPNEATKFIENCIRKKFLEKDNNQILKLSETLEKKLENWQETRKNEVTEKISSAKKINQLKRDIEKNNSSKFSVLINAFADKGTLNRSVSVSDAAFELLDYNRTKGILTTKVKGSKEEPYIIEINTITKTLRHNCHDFETRRMPDKKFCKHLTKLFLLLKKKDNEAAEFFLSTLADNIAKWDFIT